MKKKLLKNSILLFTLVSGLNYSGFSQDFKIDDGYYKVGGTDRDWVLLVEGTHCIFYKDKVLTFDFNFDNAKVSNIEGNSVKFEYMNPEAPEWQEHIILIKKSEEGFEVNISYSVMEYSEFLDTTEMTPQNFISSYFEGPFVKEEALGQ